MGFLIEKLGVEIKYYQFKTLCLILSIWIKIFFKECKINKLFNKLNLLLLVERIM